MAFPVTIDATLPANSESPSLGASRIRAVEQALLDLWQLPPAVGIAAALAITRVGPLTNSTGVTLNAGDVVALNAAADQSVVLSDVQSSQLPFVVAIGNSTNGGAISNAATGVFGQSGLMTVTAQGAITRGNYIRKSATTKAVEDTGTAASATANPPVGTIGFALTAAAGPGAGTVVAYMFGFSFGQPIPTVIGGYGVRGLVGGNNGATPNTKFDLAADLVMFTRPSDTQAFIVATVTTKTCDTGLAGPAANGRDQLAAFNASNWIHFYFIWNGTTVATVASLTAPPTGPTLPTGYTHVAYAGAVYYNATPLLVRTHLCGGMAMYDALQSVLSGGTAAGPTSLALTTFIPPNARRVIVRAQVRKTANVGGGNDAYSLQIVSGTDCWATVFDITAVAIGFAISPDVTLGLATAQTIYYASNRLGNASAMDVDVRGYSIPNGDS